MTLASCCAAPALDLDFLLAIMHKKRPLDWEAVLSSNVPLKVVASCLDTLQPVILESFTDAKDLETCLRASANVPEVRNFLLVAGCGWEVLADRARVSYMRLQSRPSTIRSTYISALDASGQPVVSLTAILVLRCLMGAMPPYAHGCH